MSGTCCPQCAAELKLEASVCPSCGRSLAAPEYRGAQEVARRIAADVGTPAFYLEQCAAVERSATLFDEDPLAARALAALQEYHETIGHGFNHIMKVAIDAGALVLVERGAAPPSDSTQRLVLLAHIAGVLHDIKRGESDHAKQGAAEAARILRDFDLRDDEAAAIVEAISNHEAFQPVLAVEDPDRRLLSDVLYDADKFRWGPDNFSEMIWDMVATFDVPLTVVLDGFLGGMEGVEKIRDTFRSETGRRYGPDFIDRGMKIGRRLYDELKGEGEGQGTRTDAAVS